MTRSGALAGVALLAAFATGMAAGYAVARPKRGGEGMSIARTQNAAALFLSRESLLDSLHLNAGQRATIDSVLQDGSRRANQAIEGIRGEVESVTRSTRDAIRAVLDERQRHVFDSTLASLPPVRMRSPLPPDGNNQRRKQ